MATHSDNERSESGPTLMDYTTIDHGIEDERVLVTGGAGFIGSRIVRSLLPDNDVVVLDDLSLASRDSVPEGATFRQGDVKDRQLLNRVVPDADIVFHQAAVSSVELARSDPERTFETNTRGTVNVLEAATGTDTRVVFASSFAVYGNPDDVPVSETDPKRPTGPYGISKLRADNMVRFYDQFHDVTTVTLRYANVYGQPTGESPSAGVVGIFFDQAAVGRPITVEGDGRQTRDFVHVYDIVRANLIAATTDNTGVAYNVATGRETEIIELAEMIAERASEDVQIIHTKPRDDDIMRNLAAVERARESLRFEPVISLEEGLDIVATGL